MALCADARALAVLDVVFQADVELARGDVFGREGQMAGTERVEVLDELEQGVQRGNVAVGPEVGGTVAHDVPRLEDAGKVFVRHADGRIGLIVLQQHVVVGLVALDEVVLQQERVFFRVHHDILDVSDLAHQHGGLPALVVFAEIGIDAPFQVLGLSYVDDGSFVVQILVASGTVGQVEDYAFQICVQLFLFFGCHSVCCGI